MFRGEEKDADPFRRLLTDEGFAVELIASAAVMNADLKKYNLLIVGWGGRDEDWGEFATAIDLAGKPVLALGEGGYTFLGQTGLKLDIGASHGWHGNDTAVRPVDVAKSLPVDRGRGQYG